MKTEQEIKELLEYALTLYQNNVSNEEIKKAMIRQGADEELADEIVKARDKNERREREIFPDFRSHIISRRADKFYQQLPTCSTRRNIQNLP